LIKFWPALRVMVYTLFALGSAALLTETLPTVPIAGLGEKKKKKKLAAEAHGHGCELLTLLKTHSVVVR
jgi:hypothetical protein